MPTWPPSDIDTTDIDSDTDSPLNARQDLLAAIQALNQIRNHVSTFMQTVLDDANAASARATLGAAGIGINDNFAAGTRMIFHNATAPTGWTQDASGWDHALRVVGSAGGGSGGTVGFSAISAQSVAGHQLSAAEMPSHSHSISIAGRGWIEPGATTYALAVIISGTTYGISAQQSGNNYADISAALTGGNTGSAGSNGSHVHGIGFQPQYTNVIICQKN